MSIVKCKNKYNGTTYVYESESYWDAEKKQPRAKRKLIGKIDETTGEIIPTGKKKNSSETKSDEKISETIANFSTQLEAKDAQISQLKDENRRLKTIINKAGNILDQYRTIE